MNPLLILQIIFLVKKLHDYQINLMLYLIRYKRLLFRSIAR